MDSCTSYLGRPCLIALPIRVYRSHFRRRRSGLLPSDIGCSLAKRCSRRSLVLQNGLADLSLSLSGGIGGGGRGHDIGYTSDRNEDREIRR
jgi:hypothetical protein